jgi:hypothetical protein
MTLRASAERDVQRHLGASPCTQLSSDAELICSTFSPTGIRK